MEREEQGRTVQPVVPAEELVARRHRESAMATVGFIGARRRPEGGASSARLVAGTVTR